MLECQPACEEKSSRSGLRESIQGTEHPAAAVQTVRIEMALANGTLVNFTRDADPFLWNAAQVEHKIVRLHWPFQHCHMKIRFLISRPTQKLTVFV